MRYGDFSSKITVKEKLKHQVSLFVGSSKARSTQAGDMHQQSRHLPSFEKPSVFGMESMSKTGPNHIAVVAGAQIALVHYARGMIREGMLAASCRDKLRIHDHEGKSCLLLFAHLFHIIL